MKKPNKMSNYRKKIGGFFNFEEEEQELINEKDLENM